jgi:transcription initiation factor TFIIB
MYDMGLATIISPKNKDASGKPLTTPMKRSIQRLRIWDNRSQASKPVSRNLRQAFSELNKLKDKLGISDFVIEKTAYIYRKATDKKLVRGRSISAMLAASLYAACRNTKTPRTLKDISHAGNLEKRDIAKCYRLLHRELNLKMPVVDSIQCVARISSILEISEKIKRRANEILKLCQKCEESAGKDPMGLAAAALYMSCIENAREITQKEIAEAANVTEVTVRNRYKSLKRDQNINLESTDL